jgi:hypothetical protein
MNAPHVHGLTWRNVSTPNLRDFIGYDGERGVACILINRPGPGAFTRSFRAGPALLTATRSIRKEARRKVEECWAYAKPNGVAAGNHVMVESWI